MKRRIISIILILMYILLTVVVALQVLAVSYVEKAEDYRASYNWTNALAMYQKALKLNPFNSEHIKKYADFLSFRSMFQVDKMAGLELSKSLYQKVIKLNKEDPSYYLSLGKLYLDIMKAKEGINKDQKEFALAIGNFKKAVEKDPTGQESSEYIYRTVTRNIDSMDLVKELSPANLSGYQRLYRYITIANLWNHRKWLKGKVDTYMEKEDPEEFIKLKKEKLERIAFLKKDYKQKLASSKLHSGWFGTLGPYKDKNGANMYWTGTVDSLLRLPSGKQIIKIKTKASSAKTIWPYMIVELDNEIIGEIFVDNADWKDYVINVNTNGGLKVLSVTFVNDGGGTRNGVKEDRNLFLGNVSIEKQGLR